MSCKKCEEFQDRGLTSYFRWGTANIEVRACSEHLKEVFAVLRGHAALKAREADLRAALEDLVRDISQDIPGIVGNTAGAGLGVSWKYARAAIKKAKGEK